MLVRSSRRTGRDLGLDAPEYAVARLVNLPRAQDGNVARKRLLHDVLAPVELARLALGAALEDLARGVEPDGDVAALQEGIYTRRYQSAMSGFRHRGLSGGCAYARQWG